MRARIHRSLAITAAVSLAVGLMAVSPSNAASAPLPSRSDHGSTAVRYVAMGDSFVSGPGIPTQRPGGCTRSDRNFPSLMAAELRFASFTDASCGGATTDNYWQPQGDNPPQLDALTPNTTLVTLGTMGGNDAGLVQLATTCLLQGCSNLPTTPYHDAIDALVPVYHDVIKQVRKRSPHAKIVAVGYGTYVPEHVCPALLNATDADLVFLQGIIDRLSDTMKSVAAQERIPFVDMRSIRGWRDHTACADPADQWIRGLTTYNDGAPLHPSTAGMRQMATKALQTIRPLVRKPTSVQRVAAAAKTVKVRAFCTGPRARKRVTVRVNGGNGLVTFARFRLGHRWIGSDFRAPFTVTRRAATLKHPRARGPVRAKVVLRHGKVVRTKTVITARPRCLR